MAKPGFKDDTIKTYTDAKSACAAIKKGRSANLINDTGAVNIVAVRFSSNGFRHQLIMGSNRSPRRINYYLQRGS
jgi:hypothetical protein